MEIGVAVWQRAAACSPSSGARLRRGSSGPVFEPLRDPAVFRQFQVHPEFHTLVWPNGADFAPEFLRDHVRLTA